MSINTHLWPNSHTPIKTKAKKVIIDAPVANPSRPSDKLTPLLADITIITIKIMTKAAPR